LALALANGFKAKILGFNLEAQNLWHGLCRHPLALASYLCPKKLKRKPCYRKETARDAATVCFGLK